MLLHQCAKGIYSLYFLIPKKSSSPRPILDLRALNRYNRSEHFYMTTLQYVIMLLHVDVRPQGSLLLDRHPPCPSPVPLVRGKRTTLPIHSSIHRSHYISQGFIQVSGGGGHSFMQSRHLCLPVHRLLADQEQQQAIMHSTHSSSSNLTPQTKVHRKCKDVPLPTSTNPALPGLNLKSATDLRL